VFDIDTQGVTRSSRTDFSDEVGGAELCSISAVIGMGGAMVLGGIAASAIGSRNAAKGARDAANAQVGAAQDASASNERIAQMQIDAQNAMFEKQKSLYEKQLDLQRPFRNIGLDATTTLTNLLRHKYGGDFSENDFKADPGYAFRLKQGMKGIESSAAARGGLISGNALRAAAQYNQDMGSQEYQNAFNRYQVNRSNQIQPWQSLAGVGQSATNAMNNSAGQLGNAISQQGAGVSNAYGQLGQGNAQAFSDMGNARASGYVGQANAINSGIGNMLNYGQNALMMSRLGGY